MGMGGALRPWLPRAVTRFSTSCPRVVMARQKKPAAMNSRPAPPPAARVGGQSSAGGAEVRSACDYIYIPDRGESDSVHALIRRVAAVAANKPHFPINTDIFQWRCPLGDVIGRYDPHWSE